MTKLGLDGRLDNREIWIYQGTDNQGSTVYKRGAFSAKMVYKRVGDWTLGWSPPILNFLKNPPPPTSGWKIRQKW